MRPEVGTRPRLPFTIDVSRAAFALALSVLLYFVALNETNPQAREQLPQPVPVQVVNVPSGLVLTSRPPDVRVSVTAPSNVFGRLNQNSFTAQVDATNAQAGANDLPVSVASSDPAVRDAVADPPSVNLTFDEVRAQDLPVRANVTGTPPTGYQRGEPSVDPSHITVTGAASIVSRASEAVVDVSVDRLTVPVNGVYSPRIVDDRGNTVDPNLRATPPSVTVQVPITQQTQYKEVGIRPVTQGEPAVGYLLQPLVVNPPTATLRGSSADLEGANFISTMPIDVSNISTTTVRTVALVPPQGTLLLQPGQTVTVTISVTTLTTTQTVRVPPAVINIGSTVQLARQPAAVAVTISGPAPALATLALNPNDFRVTLDVSGKGPGGYDIDAKVQKVPTGLTLEGVDPAKVHVDLVAAPPPPTPTPAPTAAPPAG